MAMKLVGKINKEGKTNRSALGRFASKQNSKIMVYDEYAFLIGNDNDAKKIEKEFGKPIAIRNVKEDDVTLESVKLSDIR